MLVSNHVFCFFFKQKTAYEMRISDWSSDVCSSDLETIADVLSRAGYARRSFLGKWHLGHRSLAYHPMNFGFTSFYGHYNGAIDYFTHKRQGQVDWHRNYAPSADKGSSPDLLAKEAGKIIRSPSPTGSSSEER